MIRQCDCVHRMQDRLHGAGNRVFNECKAAPGRGPEGEHERKAYRCTVCGKTQGR
jgi:hypothetical protein